MKFKIANPEDYPEIESYAFKLAKAYADNYGYLIYALTIINTTYDALMENDEFGIDFSKRELMKVLQKFTS